LIEFVKATLSDISSMQKLVVDEVKDGIILQRSNNEVATNIRSYVLAKEDNQILGYTALHIYSDKIAEIRSLIVSSSHRGRDIGRGLVLFAIEEAKELGVTQEILVLTYLPLFFEKMNFIEIDKESISEHKIWTDCIKCVHFPICNEVALIYKLNGAL